MFLCKRGITFPEIELCWGAAQVVVYNKIDVPDSGDYIDDVREFLLSEGVPAQDFFAISAATGTGVLALVRRVRQVLDELPAQVRASLFPNDASRVGTLVL